MTASTWALTKAVRPGPKPPPAGNLGRRQASERFRGPRPGRSRRPGPPGTRPRGRRSRRRSKNHRKASKRSGSTPAPVPYETLPPWEAPAPASPSLDAPPVEVAGSQAGPSRAGPGLGGQSNGFELRRGLGPLEGGLPLVSPVHGPRRPRGRKPAGRSWRPKVMTKNHGFPTSPIPKGPWGGLGAGSAQDPKGASSPVSGRLAGENAPSSAHYTPKGPGRPPQIGGEKGPRKRPLGPANRPPAAPKRFGPSGAPSRRRTRAGGRPRQGRPRRPGPAYVNG
jgi:hypothetical protein